MLVHKTTPLTAWSVYPPGGRVLAAKVGQAFLPAAQTRMSAPPDITDLEAETDRLVYGLYGLTASEIAIVERNT